MTHDEFRQKVHELKGEVSKLIDNRMEKIIKSGCIDFEAYDNDYILPKIFISAVGSEIEHQFKPYSPNDIRSVNNMKHFL